MTVNELMEYWINLNPEDEFDLEEFYTIYFYQEEYLGEVYDNCS